MKAVALLSGGLDSTLAIELLLEQGIEVRAMNFTGPFCTCSPRNEGGCHMASLVARSLGVEIVVQAKGMDYLRMVEHPRFGRGRGLNPCIDCRIYMLRRAAALMEETGAAFVATGEVLGQRPMSQHRDALMKVERESGLEGRLLRPLSAHLLEPTIPEREGLVDRERLLAIRGRSRREQLTLARERGLEVFGCPAGGCLLTDSNIARRLGDLFDRCPGWGMADARLTTRGRHFRLGDRLKVVVGHDENENEALLALSGDGPWMELADAPGPVLLLRGYFTLDDLQRAGRIARFYARKASGPVAGFRLTEGERNTLFSVSGSATEEDLDRWRI